MGIRADDGVSLALFFLLLGTMGVKAGCDCEAPPLSLWKLDRREIVEREVRGFSGTNMEVSSPSEEEPEELSTLSSMNTLVFLFVDLVGSFLGA